MHHFSWIAFLPWLFCIEHTFGSIVECKSMWFKICVCMFIWNWKCLFSLDFNFVCDRIRSNFSAQFTVHSLKRSSCFALFLSSSHIRFYVYWIYCTAVVCIFFSFFSYLAHKYRSNWNSIDNLGECALKVHAVNCSNGYAIQMI